MRNVTIKREKTPVACLAKMKIYIEDPTSYETTINDTPCRRIGDLKNGEEKTFQIGEQAAKIYVIPGRRSNSFCNEFYQLPDGQEDIRLSGKNRYNPAAGNAFRFDNNMSEEVLANRKRATRRGLLFLAVAVMVGAIAGFWIGLGLRSGRTPKMKTFSSDGMTVTLTNEFKEVEIENYTATYDSKNVGVFVLKEAFTLAEGMEHYSLEQYADLVIQNNNIGPAEIKTDGGLTHFEYKFVNPETKVTYRFFAYVYKTNDAFWLMQFATRDENAENSPNRLPGGQSLSSSLTETAFLYDI